MDTPPINTEFVGPDSPHFSGEQTDTTAWEEVDEGRFMPRRIRGSCQGRALG